jgi:hypothetical protein
MSQSGRSNVAAAQRAWASSHGYAVDERGYLDEVASNLLGGLSAGAQAAFEAADGAELTDTADRPAKMRSVISSSALALNVFQEWTRADPVPLGAALGLPDAVVTVQFERRMRTGAGGTPPNLDVVLTTRGGTLVGIESKFTEWMTAKQGHAARLAPYLRKEPSLWEVAGLKGCARLASEIHSSTQRFAYLDVPQLLKHALGLRGAGVSSWALYYIWYDASGDASRRHADELDRFAQLVGDELRFQALSYQTLVSRLSRQSGIDGAYLTYLQQRYELGKNNKA